MSKIDRNNYEAFYLDYLEGNLSKENSARLKLFLEENPDLKAELEEFEMVEVSPEPVVQFNKELLKKNITNNNIEDYIIASIEEQISTDDEIELQEFLKKTPEAQKLANRYKKTILPKLTIFYPHKNKLKVTSKN